MYTYSPLQTLMQVIFLLLWAFTGITCIEAIETGSTDTIFWVGIIATIVALSAQITLLISQIIHNNHFSE